MTFTGPRAEDGASIDALLAALYDTISGPAGERDWPRERSLFYPGARLQPMRAGEGGRPAVDVFDVEAYIASRSQFFADHDLYEVEIGKKTERFGNLAHVWSHYEGRETPTGPAWFRGTNSAQLYWDGDRWWILSLAWDNERSDKPLPAELFARS